MKLYEKEKYKGKKRNDLVLVMSERSIVELKNPLIRVCSCEDPNTGDSGGRTNKKKSL